MVTVVLIFVVVNAINLIDGLDGLAAGVVAIGAGAFFAYAYLLSYEQELVRATTSSLITVATVGVCLGFLPYNIHRARMFMGDSGAMLLGFLLATSMISLTGQLDPSSLSRLGANALAAYLPLLLPLAVMALPFLDLVLAYVRRTLAGKLWYQADKQHLHHRMLEPRAQPRPGRGTAVAVVGADRFRSGADRARPLSALHRGPDRWPGAGGLSDLGTAEREDRSMTEVSANVRRARRLLAGGAVGGHAVLVLAVVGFGLTLGLPAAASAAVAGILTIAFLTIGQAVQILVADAAPTTVLVAALTSYTVRVTVLGLLLVLALDNADRIALMNPMVVVVTTIGVVTGWLGAEFWVYSRMRILIYDEPENGANDGHLR